MRAIALLVLIISPFACRADTIVFKNGQELEGKVLEQDEHTILFQVEYGTMRISKDRVERVDPETPEQLAKREAARKAREEAAKANSIENGVQQEIEKAVAERAKARAQQQAAAKAAAQAKAAAKAAQKAQPQWADQYVEWRRTMRTGKTQGNSLIRDPNTSRQLFDRSAFVNGSSRDQGRSGGSGNAARARMPFDVSQLPNGMTDLARKYIGGR